MLYMVIRQKNPEYTPRRQKTVNTIAIDKITVI